MSVSATVRECQSEGFPSASCTSFEPTVGVEPPKALLSLEWLNVSCLELRAKGLKSIWETWKKIIWIN